MKSIDYTKVALQKIAEVGQQEVELKSKTIELADFADIETQLKKAEEAYKELQDLWNVIYKAKQDLKSSKGISSLNRITRELINDRDKFISKVKDLGINPGELKQPKEYEKAIKRVQDLETYATKVTKEELK